MKASTHGFTHESRNLRPSLPLPSSALSFLFMRALYIHPTCEPSSSSLLLVVCLFPPTWCRSCFAADPFHAWLPLLQPFGLGMCSLQHVIEWTSFNSLVLNSGYEKIHPSPAPEANTLIPNQARMFRIPTSTSPSSLHPNMFSDLVGKAEDTQWKNLDDSNDETDQGWDPDPTRPSSLGEVI